MLIRKTVRRSGSRYIIKIDSHLEWLFPYIVLSRKCGVPIHLIKKIRGYYVNEDKLERQVAQCARYMGRFTISLLRLRQGYEMTKRRGFFKVCGWNECTEGHFWEDTLQSLAHELSHTLVWSHNADRLLLESKIMLLFAKLAKEQGYKGYGRIIK